MSNPRLKFMSGLFFAATIANVHAGFEPSPMKNAKYVADACELLLRKNFSTLLPMDCNAYLQLGWSGETRNWNICPNGKDETLETKAFIFISYVKDHPNQQNKAWNEVAKAAFEKEWPCTK
jgi:hypothetical protein